MEDEKNLLKDTHGVLIDDWDKEMEEAEKLYGTDTGVDVDG